MAEIGENSKDSIYVVRNTVVYPIFDCTQKAD